MWNTVRDLKDLIYENDFREELHIQNRTLNSILAKYTSCADLNVLYKMHLDAKALKYLYERKIHNIPMKKSDRKSR